MNNIVRLVPNNITSMLTDIHQIYMALSYFDLNRHNEDCTFDLYFKKSPFNGQITIFAGLEDILDFLVNFKFYPNDIEYLKTVIPHGSDSFWEWLSNLDTTGLSVYAMKEGTVCFGNEVLIRFQGPVALCQLLKTILQNLSNYSTLITTNAARMKLVCGKATLTEFGLRNSQGPNGAMTASAGAYRGGFDYTSNILAAQKYNIPVFANIAYAFILSMTEVDQLPTRMITCADGTEVDFVKLVLDIRFDLKFETNEGELTAFIGYAMTYPEDFIALVDTYDAIKSGIPNFISVGRALITCGYTPRGFCINNGDIAEISNIAKDLVYSYAPYLDYIEIIGSNDISYESLLNLLNVKHEITNFRSGSNLVNCYDQANLGMMYDLVDITGFPRVQSSEYSGSIIIPGRKNVYRLVDENGIPLMDYINLVSEEAPVTNELLNYYNINDLINKLQITAVGVQPLLNLVMTGGDASTSWRVDSVPLIDQREYVQQQLGLFPKEILQPINPVAYNIGISEQVWNLIRNVG
jgi:nicotinate phosphoribosyltransferase